MRVCVGGGGWDRLLALVDPVVCCAAVQHLPAVGAYVVTTTLAVGCVVRSRRSPLPSRLRTSLTPSAPRRWCRMLLPLQHEDDDDYFTAEEEAAAGFRVAGAPPCKPHMARHGSDSRRAAEKESVQQPPPPCQRRAYW